MRIGELGASSKLDDCDQNEHSRDTRRSAMGEGAWLRRAEKLQAEDEGVRCRQEAEGRALGHHGSFVARKGTRRDTGGTEQGASQMLGGRWAAERRDPQWALVQRSSIVAVVTYL